MDLAFSPDGRRLAVASRQQVKLMDTETAEEVLTLRGRAQLLPNTHGFNPRVRFSPDGRSLFAICDDWSDTLAVWSSSPGQRRRDRGADPHGPPSRGRPAPRPGRKALVGTAGRERHIALDHLDHAGRIGLESPEEFLKRAAILADLDLWEGRRRPGPGRRPGAGR